MRIYSPPAPDLSPIKLYQSAYRVRGSEFKNAEVRYPDANLILDLPKDQKFEIVTKGMMVCSGVAIGFVNDDDYFGMYLSHTTPHMAQQAVEGVENVIDIAMEEGFEPVCLATLGNARSPEEAHRKTIIPMVKKLGIHYGIIADYQTYTEPSDWYFITNGGAFDSTKTPHCVPLPLMNV